jgi:hypothetical protein
MAIRISVFHRCEQSRQFMKTHNCCTAVYIDLSASGRIASLFLKSVESTKHKRFESNQLLGNVIIFHFCDYCSHASHQPFDRPMFDTSGLFSVYKQSLLFSYLRFWRWYITFGIMSCSDSDHYPFSTTAPFPQRSCETTTRKTYNIKV